MTVDQRHAHQHIADLDLALKRIVDAAVLNGIGRGAILHLLIDHAFESQSASGVFPTPEHARDNARAVLDEALRKLLEYRTAIMQALGAERRRKPTDE
jgi:hypothetical protein